LYEGAKLTFSRGYVRYERPKDRKGDEKDESHSEIEHCMTKSTWKTSERDKKRVTAKKFIGGYQGQFRTKT